MIYLKAANLEDAKKEYEFISQTPAEENGFMNSHSGCTYEEFVEKVLPHILDNAKGIDLSPGHVPQTEFFLWEDEQIIGLFKIRHYLNDALANGAGHIGYGIRKEYRGRGYATKGLELAVEMAWTMIQEDEIYMSVNKDNLASLKVQLKNGAYIHHEDEKEYYTRIEKAERNAMEMKCLRINELTEENIASVKASFPLRYKAANNKAKKEDAILSFAGTYLLSQMLPSLKEDDIKYEEMGKPVFDDGFFSISHSGDRVYVVTSKTPVGVDVESINRPINSSIVRLFTENEQSWIAGDNLKALKIWCLKEAVLKAVGYGITKPLDSFDVAPFMDGNQIEYEGRSWNGSVAEEDGYIVAVVEEAK